MSPSPCSTPSDHPTSGGSAPSPVRPPARPDAPAWGWCRSPARPPPARCGGRAARFPARHSAGPHRRRRTRRSLGGGWRSGTGPPAVERGIDVRAEVDRWRGVGARLPKPEPGPRIPFNRFRRDPRDRGDGSFDAHVALLIARRRGAPMLPAPAASRHPNRGSVGRPRRRPDLGAHRLIRASGRARSRYRDSARPVGSLGPSAPRTDRTAHPSLSSSPPDSKPTRPRRVHAPGRRPGGGRRAGCRTPPPAGCPRSPLGCAASPISR